MKKILNFLNRILGRFKKVPNIIFNILSNSILRVVLLCVVCISVGLTVGLNFEDITQAIKEKKESKVVEVTESEVSEEEKAKLEELEKEKKEAQLEKEAKESLEKINTKYKIEKAKYFVKKLIGDSTDELVYIGDETPARIQGEYYIFGINVCNYINEDKRYYVDKNTFEVYEDANDGYFGKYRMENSVE